MFGKIKEQHSLFVLLKVQSCKHDNLAVGSLEDLKILHFKTIWFLIYLTVQFRSQQRSVETVKY